MTTSPPTPPPSPADSTDPAFVPTRCLVIDDDKLQRMIMSRLLHRNGAQHVIEAASGEEAIRIVTGNGSAFDLIVSDLSMPGTNGIDLLVKLRRLSGRTPIAVMTSAESDVIDRTERLAGLQNVNLIGSLRKPFSENDLVGLLARITPRERNDEALSVSQRADIRPDQDREWLDLALQQDRVRVYCQPQLNIESGSLSGIEMLARIRNDFGDLMAPSQFIRLAEESTLVDELTINIIDKALSARRSLQSAQGLTHAIVVNVPTATLTRVKLSRLMGQTRQARVDMRNLIFELSGPMDNLERSATPLREFPARIFGIAMTEKALHEPDAFINMVRKWPTAEIQVQESTIAAAWGQPELRRALAHISEFASRESLRMVAKAVETERQLTKAQAAGCTDAQGYYLARPMPVQDVGDWVKRYGNQNLGL